MLFYIIQIIHSMYIDILIDVFRKLAYGDGGIGFAD